MWAKGHDCVEKADMSNTSVKLRNRSITVCVLGENVELKRWTTPSHLLFRVGKDGEREGKCGRSVYYGQNTHYMCGSWYVGATDSLQ